MVCPSSKEYYLLHQVINARTVTRFGNRDKHMESNPYYIEFQYYNLISPQRNSLLYCSPWAITQGFSNEQISFSVTKEHRDIISNITIGRIEYDRESRTLQHQRLFRIVGNRTESMIINNNSHK